MIRVPMTKAQFDATAKRLQAEQGVILAGRSGDLSHEGVTAHYEFDGSELMVTIARKPMFVTAGYVEGQIRKWLGAN